MKQATARFRRPANGGVRLGRARSAARLLMFVLLLAALVLLTLAVFYYTRNTAQAMEAELCQKMLVSAGQTRNNIDYRFEQVKESASALIGTLYPYLNSDADTAVQLEEYAKIRRALSEQLDKHMITRLRLYVPDEKIYSGQKTTLYSLDPLSSLGENGSVYQKGGVFWHGTHLVSLGISEPTAVVSCAVALKSQADYDKLCGVLFADVSVSQFHEIFAAGSTNHDEMFLADAQGRILAHTDDAHLGETALPPSLMEQVCSLGSGYLLEPDVILAFSRLETTEWYVISSMPRAQVYTMDSGAVNTIVSMWVVACLILLSSPSRQPTVSISTVPLAASTQPSIRWMPKTGPEIPIPARDAAKEASSRWNAIPSRSYAPSPLLWTPVTATGWLFPNIKWSRCRLRSSRIFFTTRWMSSSG